MKLNQMKCAFDFEAGKFQDFMVLEWGIKANPEKVEAIFNIASPQNINYAHRLTTWVVALNQFVSRLMDKCLSFFKVLQKAQAWDDKCNQVFKTLKRYLTSPPLLSQPEPEEALNQYLLVSPHAISSALL